MYVSGNSPFLMLRFLLFFAKRWNVVVNSNYNSKCYQNYRNSENRKMQISRNVKMFVFFTLTSFPKSVVLLECIFNAIIFCRMSTSGFWNFILDDLLHIVKSLTLTTLTTDLASVLITSVIRLFRLHGWSPPHLRQL